MTPSSQQIPLVELSVDEHGTILSFNDVRAVTTRLASLGFTPGAEINMTQNYGHGPLIVTVRGRAWRWAAGRPPASW